MNKESSKVKSISMRLERSASDLPKVGVEKTSILAITFTVIFLAGWINLCLTHQVFLKEALLCSGIILVLLFNHFSTKQVKPRS